MIRNHQVNSHYHRPKNFNNPGGARMTDQSHSLILWGSIFGLVGMVLCVPITMTLKFALETNEQTRWLAVLLGREPSTSEVG
jgi:hypothetical protein